MRTGLTKQEKTTDIWFDEKDSLIHIRTHNTDTISRAASAGNTRRKNGEVIPLHISGNPGIFFTLGSS